MIRSVCTVTPRGIRWRDDRSWLLVEQVQWHRYQIPSEKSALEDDQLGDAVLTGTVRGKGFKADRLVQLAGFGMYAIDKIMEAALAVPHKKWQANPPQTNDNQDILLDQPTDDRDEIMDLAPFESTMTDLPDTTTSSTDRERKGVLLDDHHYFSEDDVPSSAPLKRLPKGTSSYQAAWFLDDDTESSLELDEVDQDGDLTMNKAQEGSDSAEKNGHFGQMYETEGAPSVMSASEIFLDPSPEEEMDQLAAFRRRQKSEAQEDLEFPDEIELSPKVIARERLIRYRGLKSIRTSPWETNEDKSREPNDWHRLLRIKNYKGTKNRVMREALVGGVPV